MNGKRAKIIRKKIYGDNFSPRFRKYYRNNETGQIIADNRRRMYQLAKKEWQISQN